MNIDEHRPALSDVFIQHGVVLAYLFGSQAEGTARPSSDIDFAVLLPPGTPRERFFGPSQGIAARIFRPNWAKGRVP